MVEATRAHDNYKIIQNSILQVIFGLQNFVGNGETGHCGVRIFVAIVLTAREDQTEFVWLDYVRFTDRAQMELSSEGRPWIQFQW